MKPLNLFIPLRLVAVLSVSSYMSEAASLTWDGNSTTAPNPSNNSGAWDTTTTNWWDGSSNVLWPTTGTDNDAAFSVAPTSSTSTVTIASGGVTAHNLTFATTASGNQYNITGDTLTLNGTAPTISIGTNMTSQISSVIDGSDGLTKSGAGGLILSGANIYTGGTTINAGTLSLGSANAIGTSGTVSFGGGTLQYSASNATDYSDRFSNAASQQYKVDTNSQNVTLASNLTSSGGSFTKLGAGTLTISGINTYNGATTVSAGQLTINGSIANSTTTVSSGATLGGSGTVGALTINSGGFVNPGNSPGILTVNGNYSQAGRFTAEIAGTTAGVGYDQIDVTGTVNITGGNLVTLFSGSYSANDTMFILLNDGADAINGTYTGFAQGATVASYGGFDWLISYNANSSGNTFTGGNDIALMAIPEPSIAALASCFAVFTLLRRRR